MTRHALVIATIVFILIPNRAWADGLVYQLPEDGSWVRFDTNDEAEESKDKMVHLSGTTTLSSVGRVELDGKRCRWIEIVSELKRNDQAITEIDKLLIPEEHLGKGKDPLKHVVKAWRQHSMIAGGPKQVENLKEEGRGKRYLEKLRPFLHEPFEGTAKLENMAIDYKRESLMCEGIAAAEKVEQGNVTLNSTYTIRLHEKIPFGVVGWECSTKVERDGKSLGTMKMKMKVADFGKGATSAIPDAN